MSLVAKELFNLRYVDFNELFDDGFVYEVFPRLKEYIVSNIKKQNSEAREKIAIIKEGAFIEGDVYIGRGTVVEPGAYIKGPTIIGKNCEIRQGAYIRGSVITGNDCVIGHATEIKNSIMLNGAKAGHFAYVGDSILGNNVNLGAGVKLANLKVFNSKVILNMKNNIYKTNLRKIGAILADNVEIGCNTVTAPGTIIGKNSKLYSNLAISGYIDENKLVKNKSLIEIVDIIS